MFVREGILDPLSTALLSILNDTTLQDEEPGTRAINVLLLFCQIAQADARIREVFATRTIMIRTFRFRIYRRSKILAERPLQDC